MANSAFSERLIAFLNECSNRELQEAQHLFCDKGSLESLLQIIRHIARIKADRHLASPSRTETKEERKVLRPGRIVRNSPEQGLEKTTDRGVRGTSAERRLLSVVQQALGDKALFASTSDVVEVGRRIFEAPVDYLKSQRPSRQRVIRKIIDHIASQDPNKRRTMFQSFAHVAGIDSETDMAYRELFRLLAGT